RPLLHVRVAGAEAPGSRPAAPLPWVDAAVGGDELIYPGLVVRVVALAAAAAGHDVSEYSGFVRSGIYQLGEYVFSGTVEVHADSLQRGEALGRRAGVELRAKEVVQPEQRVLRPLLLPPQVLPEPVEVD